MAFCYWIECNRSPNLIVQLWSLCGVLLLKRVYRVINCHNTDVDYSRHSFLAFLAQCSTIGSFGEWYCYSLNRTKRAPNRCIARPNIRFYYYYLNRANVGHWINIKWMLVHRLPNIVSMSRVCWKYTFLFHFVLKWWRWHSPRIHMDLNPYNAHISQFSQII